MAAAATAAAADVPDSFGGICGLLGGIGGGTPRPPTEGIIVFLMVVVVPPTMRPDGLPAGDADAFRTVAICWRQVDAIHNIGFIFTDGGRDKRFAVSKFLMKLNEMISFLFVLLWLLFAFKKEGLIYAAILILRYFFLGKHIFAW